MSDETIDKLSMGRIIRILEDSDDSCNYKLVIDNLYRHSNHLQQQADEIEELKKDLIIACDKHEREYLYEVNEGLTTKLDECFTIMELHKHAMVTKSSYEDCDNSELIANIDTLMGLDV